MVCDFIYTFYQRKNLVLDTNTEYFMFQALHLASYSQNLFYFQTLPLLSTYNFPDEKITLQYEIRILIKIYV